MHLLSVDVRGLRWALMLPIVQGWVRFALPVGGERTFPSRSQPSGSTNPPFWYAQGRVAVPVTLPHGVERGKSVRSGPSGSANQTFWYAWGRVAVPVTLPLGGERTSPHVHSRVAVKTHRSGTLGAEWQCKLTALVRSGPSGSAGHTATWRRAWEVGTLGAEWQCKSDVLVRLGPSGSAGHTATRW